MATNSEASIENLVQWHVADQLQGYLGNLAAVEQVVQNDWLPEASEPEFQGHIQTLQRYLAEAGHPEDDKFLLCFGLTVPGTLRGIVPPLMVLDSNRGGFSLRRQGEAEGQIRRLRDALEIGRRFLPNLSHETRGAIAELAGIVERRPRFDDTEVLARFSELGPDQAEQLAEQAVKCLGDVDGVKEIGQSILVHLVNFRQPPLSRKTCDALIEQRAFYPGCLYRESGNEIAERILLQIDGSIESLVLNHLLLALAWTRSDAAWEAFAQWSAQPPPWHSKLHVTPEDYLPSAGWCLDDDGNRRDLISTTCFRLVPTETSDPRNIRCRGSINKRCPNCESRLTLLFDFSSASPNYFPGEFAEAPRRIPFCSLCACYGPVFASYQRDGTWEWLAGETPRVRGPARGYVVRPPDREHRLSAVCMRQRVRAE